MNVENVRVILERTFQMPVAESDAQIVLDRINEILSDEPNECVHGVNLDNQACSICEPEKFESARH